MSSGTNYQAWLKLGHVDGIQNPETCKSCGINYEIFTAEPKSCAEIREAAEEAKKQEEQRKQYAPWSNGWNYGY